MEEVNSKIYKMSKYPECDKMKEVSEKSQAIGEFIEWLGYEKNIYLMHEDETPVRMSMEVMLAEFYNIDLKKVEQERQQMLDEIRSQNK